MPLVNMVMLRYYLEFIFDYGRKDQNVINNLGVQQNTTVMSVGLVYDQ